MSNRESMQYDVVIVGGGPAGLAAAVWLARYRRAVTVVDSGEYRNGRVEQSHGYLGRDPQQPMELLARSRQQLLAYPTATLLTRRVVGVTRAEDGRFRVSVDGESQALVASRLVLACGVEDVLPDVAGIEEHYGASAFHCPACDGYEAQDRDIVALGWDRRLVGFAGTLLQWARSVTVVTDGRTFAGDEQCRAALAANGIEIVEVAAERLLGSRGALTGVALAGGRVLPASLLFFSVAHRPRHAFASALGCAVDDEGYLVVDDCGLTTVSGVYAAGDLTPGLQLVQVAAAKGVVAGVACAQGMFGEAGAPSAPAPAPSPSLVP